MSLTSLLSTAKSALITHQRAMDVTGHNIANVATDGYTRQRLDIIPADPFRTPKGTIGRGVTDTGVYAVRDIFLDQAYRREQGATTDASTFRDLIGRVEAVFGEPSDTGLGAAIDRFFDAFSDLANDPASLPARTAVQQSGELLARQVNDISLRIQAIERDAREQFSSSLAQVNEITSQVADLNVRIIAEGGPNATAPDLEDQRNRLLDQLSELVDTRVQPRGNGSVAVIVGDTLVVDAGRARVLEERTLPGGGLGFGTVGSTLDVQPRGGELGALSRATESEIAGIRGALDTLVSELVGEVNTQHAAGMTAGGATGINFFDPVGVTASTMRLDAAILASADNIAAGATANSGDGANALLLAGLRDTNFAGLGNQPPAEYYTSLVANVANSVYQASLDADASGVLAESAFAQRASLTGVSTDEELVQLILHQQAFAAASRLVTAADEMFQDLLGMV